MAKVKKEQTDGKDEFFFGVFPRPVEADVGTPSGDHKRPVRVPAIPKKDSRPQVTSLPKPAIWDVHAS